MKNSRAIIIGIVAGEVSGDILGAGLIRALKKRLTTRVRFCGIGGAQMRLEGMECWYDITDLSVMGITEIIFRLPSLLSIRRDLINRFLELKPDIFIGVDFPDFNISLEKRLKKKGIFTIHYVSPSVWAWRYNRVFDIKKATNMILVLFPFEKLIYDRLKIPCQCVGHVLADQIPLDSNKNYMRQKLGIANNKYCLAILPGSRSKEIKMLGNIFVNCAKLLNKNISNLEIIVSLNSQELINQFIQITSLTTVKLRILKTQKSWEIMTAADVSLLASGTVTLECMLSKCPMVVAYRMHPLTYFLLKKLVKISWISLPNLLSGYNLVQELIQKNCNPINLSRALLTLLNYNENQRSILYKKFYELHKSIRLNANEQATYLILKILKFK